jgi:hypothetical protein
MGALLELKEKATLLLVGRLTPWKFPAALGGLKQPLLRNQVEDKEETTPVRQ